MQTFHNLHDKGYKRLFRNRTLFRQLLETFVHEPWVNQLDFDRCEYLDKSFVSEQYQATESDLIYKLKLKSKDVYIIILLEFQSSVDHFMALRVLRYITDFYLDYIHSHKRVKRLPPVFPLVVYNGKKSWTAPAKLGDLIAYHNVLGKFALHCEYFTIAERAFRKEELLKIHNIVSTLFLTEAHYDLETFRNEFLHLFRHEQDRQAVSLFFNWFKQLSRHGRITEADYAALEAHIYQSEEEVAMLVEEIRKEKQQMYEQGLKQGKLDIAYAMLLKGLSIPLIAEITGLSKEEIETVKNEQTSPGSNN